MLGKEELIIELRVVKNFYRSVFQYIRERREVIRFKGVYNESFVRGGELEQAHPAVAGVEARGFGVYADSLGARKGFGDSGKLFCSFDKPVVGLCALPRLDSSRIMRLHPQFAGGGKL